jgi:hypothetical protein
MSGPFGVLRGEEIGAYHQNDAVSSTRLMDLRPCPLFYYGRHIAKTIPGPKSDAFDIGNAAHWLILEGRAALEARTVLQPATYDNDKGESKPWTYAANVCKAWREMHRGKVILCAEDFALVDRMAAAVGENPDAAALLSGGESEVTFRVQHPAFAVQCRADMWHATILPARERGPLYELGPTCVDLKTCDTIERFRSEYFKLRYYYRAAFYIDVIEQVTGERPAFVFVVVEKSAPYRCEVFEPSEADLELGRNEMLADLKTLKGCFESGIWPGSKLGVQPIELTAWQRKIAEANGQALFEEAVA